MGLQKKKIFFLLFKTTFINCGFKVNLKLRLSIMILRLIFKNVIDE